MIEKSFDAEFYLLLEKLKSGENFAFNRFSDGELFILQNKELILGDNLIKIGDKIISGPYKKEDHKHFDPLKHSFYAERLWDAFKYKEENYFKGLSCACCVGEENFKWQLAHLSELKNDKHLTWANLLVNGNYPRFINEMLPVLANKNVVYICNENANLEMMKFVKHSFLVGYNAMVNDYGVINTIANWIKDNAIEDHVFLFSASTLSKLAIHQLFQKFKNNTYIDVGTTLNAFMNMSVERQYLGDFWYEKESPSDIYKICTW